MRQARGTQYRTGHAQGHAAGQIQVSDALRARLEDVVLGHQVFELGQPPGQDRQQLGNPGLTVLGQIGGQTAGPDEGIVHSQSGERLEDAQDQVTFPEPEEHHRHRAEFHTAGCQRDQVRGDAVEFHQHHPHDRGAPRNVISDAQKFFHAQAVGGFVEER